MSRRTRPRQKARFTPSVLNLELPIPLTSRIAPLLDERKLNQVGRICQRLAFGQQARRAHRNHALLKQWQLGRIGPRFGERRPNDPQID
jgi:hypothetical protein